MLIYRCGMALPTAYLTSTKNLDGMLSAIQTAQAPSRFTLAFLENLGYKSSSDRLIINVLKALGFLNADGAPTERYYRFLDQLEAPRVVAEGLRDAYSDLYQLNRNAHTMGRAELRNKFRTLTQGQASDSVVTKMANTFLELAKHADFATQLDQAATTTATDEAPEAAAADGPEPEIEPPFGMPRFPGQLVYNIAIHLPESRDRAVYDALFRSLNEHLFE